MDKSLDRWLLLREPADAMARSERLTGAVIDVLAARRPDTLWALDLATGTGSNVRYLADRVRDRQSWLVVDRDQALLALVPSRTSTWAASRHYDARANERRCVIQGAGLDCRIETRRMDLGTLDTPDIFGGRHLVTASALLDLVSESWLRTLAGRCRVVGAAVLFALNYDGVSRCSPTEPEDDWIRQLLNRHQGRDKGLGGPAAGPNAAACTERCFADAGYEVQTARSDWRLGPAEAELQRLLIEGWATAAKEMAPDEISSIEGWRSRRLGHVAADRSHVAVGHLDLAAWPS